MSSKIKIPAVFTVTSARNRLDGVADAGR